MLDIKSQLLKLKRPKLLMEAARFGRPNYRRKTHLRRVLKGEVPQKAGAVLIQLCDIEEHMNTLRKTRDAGYSAARHVEVLIALTAEAQRFISRAL